MKFILSFLLLMGGTTIARSQQSVVVVFDSIRFSIDSMSAITAFTRKEQSGCVSRWRRVTTQTTDSIFPLQITQARVDSTDSLDVYARMPLCDEGTPTIHSHIVRNTCYYVPSQIDLNTAQLAPFSFLIMGGTPETRIFGRKPSYPDTPLDNSC